MVVSTYSSNRLWQINVGTLNVSQMPWCASGSILTGGVGIVETSTSMGDTAIKQNFLGGRHGPLHLKQTYEMVGQFFKKHWQCGKKHTVSHFVAMSLNEQRVYCIIARWEQGGPMDRKRGQGRKAIKMPPRKITQLTRLALHRPSISTTKLAWKFTIHQSYIVKIVTIGRYCLQKMIKGTKIWRDPTAEGYEGMKYFTSPLFPSIRIDLSCHGWWIIFSISQWLAARKQGLLHKVQ